MGSTFSTEIISNNQLNKTASIRTWNLIKNSINNGNLNFEIKICKNDYDGIKDRLNYIKKYINDNYLNGSGLILSHYQTNKWHDHDYRLCISIKEYDTIPIQ